LLRQHLPRDPEYRPTGVARNAIHWWHYPHYHQTRPYGAVRSGQWKLFEYFEDGRLKLYQLAKDPGEQNDLAAAMPDKAKELRRKLHQWRGSVGAQMPQWQSGGSPADP
jgi:arylsulfatase A-like enzyme